MATVVNDVDSILRAAATRLYWLDLPGNITVPLAQIPEAGALAGQDTVNLATQVVGNLPHSNVSGLGSLALQEAVNGATQVTNLGGLAYADVVVAGKMAAGSVNATNILATDVVVTGHLQASGVSELNSVSAIAADVTRSAAGLGWTDVVILPMQIYALDTPVMLTVTMSEITLDVTGSGTGSFYAVLCDHSGASVGIVFSEVGLATGQKIVGPQTTSVTFYHEPGYIAGEYDWYLKWGITNSATSCRMRSQAVECVAVQHKR